MPKYALITGASRGIGKQTAFLFAEKGFQIFLNCHSSVNELSEVKDQIERNGGRAYLVPGDVGDPACVAQIFEQIRQVTPHLDVLINNAGIAYIGLMHEMTDADWNRVIQTNLSSVFYCCRAAIPGMLSEHSGRIINISSIWGNTGASCEVAYSAAKSGINGLTRALAKELALSGITVNALSLGVIDTSMNGQLSAEERAALETEIPLGRFGTVEEAARMIWDIADAPLYLTGQVIGLDGAF